MLSEEEMNEGFYPLRRKSGITDLRMLTQSYIHTPHQFGDWKIDDLNCGFKKAEKNFSEVSDKVSCIVNKNYFDIKLITSNDNFQNSC